MGRGACKQGRRGAHADGGCTYMHAEGDVRAREQEGGCITIPFPSLFACACPAVCVPRLPPRSRACLPRRVRPASLPVRVRARPAVCTPLLPRRVHPLSPHLHARPPRRVHAPPPPRFVRVPPPPIYVRTPPLSPFACARPPPLLPVCVRARAPLPVRMRTPPPVLPPRCVHAPPL
jgi:hypothetical protein